MPAHGHYLARLIASFRLLGAAAALLGLGSCTDSSPIFSAAPEIEFISLVRENPRAGFAANEVLSTFNPALGESMLLTVSFRDGDGDLGVVNPNRNTPKNWVMRDIRPALPSAFPYVTSGTPSLNITDTTTYSAVLPELVSDNRRPSIEGTIVYRLNVIEALPILTCSSNPSLRQEAIFEIFMIDRAGNRSNTIRTAPVFVRCQ